MADLKTEKKKQLDKIFNESKTKGLAINLNGLRGC